MENPNEYGGAETPPVSHSSASNSDTEKEDDEPELDELAQMDKLMGGVFSRFEDLQEKEKRKQMESEEGDMRSGSAGVRTGVVGQEENDSKEAGGAKAKEATAVTKIEAPQKKEAKSKLSNKQLKALIRPSISSLKIQAPRPDVVEAWDTTAPDPKLLVWLKAYRNTVRVPQHWSQKRKHLSGKRAVEKVPFKLPEYIEQTKISEIRAAILEKESRKTLKQQQRDKARPKSQRLHLDFKVLHDAFFKYATKPELSLFGDVYFEGKEFEDKARAFKPGILTPKLREALGLFLPSHPPPWLLPMQRFGPPPSYPNLKLPGITPGAGPWTGQAMQPAAPKAPPQFWGEPITLINSDDEDENDVIGEAPPPADSEGTTPQAVEAQ